jgi:hypothetical protein
MVVISTIPLGIVAENNRIFAVFGIKEIISLIVSRKPFDNISSASSNTKVCKYPKEIFFLLIKSKTRPGLPTKTCGPSFNLSISAPTFVPPINKLTFTFKYSPKN